MKAMLKFIIPVDDQPHKIELPGKARLLKAHCFDDEAAEVVSWWEVDGQGEPETRQLLVINTGAAYSDKGTAIATVIHEPSHLVWHLLSLFPDTDEDHGK